MSTFFDIPLGDVKAWVFDMDGLIFDTESLYKKAWFQAAEDMGFPLTEGFYDKLIGLRVDLCEDKFRSHANDECPGFNSDLYIETKNRHIQTLFAGHIPLKSGFDALWQSLNQLQSNHPIALVTSSSQHSVDRNFADHGYVDQFHSIVTGEHVKHPKPNPQCYELICQKLGVAPEEIIVFEDSNQGVEAAHVAGCNVFMVPDMIEPTNESVARAKGILNSLIDANAELLRAFER